MLVIIGCVLLFLWVKSIEVSIHFGISLASPYSNIPPRGSTSVCTSLLHGFSRPGSVFSNYGIAASLGPTDIVKDEHTGSF